MSASAKLESICMFDRSCAIWNSVGVWKLAATVCPTSIERATMTPDTGERITA